MALTCGMFMPAYATEIDDTKEKAEELENKKKTAESEKTSLANQLSNLVNEMEKTKKKISDKESEISNKEDELILAKANENDQYESMKKRIRFMYENGNTGFIEILCSSKSIGEFLNNAEYISTISGYDRNMLVEFQKVVTDVENQEAELQKEYKQLQTMQDDLIAKQDNVNQLLTSKQSEIQKLDSELGDTKNKLAQLEAAAAAANLGSKTCLITMDMNKIGQMSCNPAVGGIAKGQIVREIDALGGQMGLVTDETAIQFRILNRSKGPAMWSPRAQCDRAKFIWSWRERLENTPNLHIWQDTVCELLVENGEVTGLVTVWGVTFKAKCIVLTAGTFLNGLMHVGRHQLPGGRMAEPASYQLTESIARHGITYGRMKTGTPVRIDARSVHFDQMETQDGECDFHKFSFMNTSTRHLKQLQCWTCYTNEEVHRILRDGLPDSPLFNGQIQSIGPRYCPSIETKIVTFPDKDQHQLFLEPEGETTQELYLNGFSSSLPMDIQIAALKKIPAFKDLVIYRPGYAIEYDYFDPTQLKHTLESKVIKNLFFAGQVNGTTGYEEAGGQGAIAGINAHINCHGGEEFTLARDEAYIGVLIDDLVTKGVDEPYRMFTSRAEYRILLRMDDADMRLTERAYKLGLAKEDRYRLMKSKKEAVEQIISFARNYSMKPALINDALEKIGTTPLRQGCKLIEILNRPQVTIENIAEHVPAFQRELEKATSANQDRKEEILEAAEILIKYQGYIDRERMIAEKLARLESIKIKGKFDYSSIQSLSTEARQKLTKIDPETIAQASRIPGVSPSDINVLLVLSGR